MNIMDCFTLVKKEIDAITRHAPSEIEYQHSQSILAIVLRLNPNADDALKIAALGHDIDRSIPEKRIRPEEFIDYKEYKRQHSIRSAEIISEIMKSCGCKEDLIERTRVLIENHEVGGSGDVEILKDADSISFFQDNLSHYHRTYPDVFKDKIRFMYIRLSPKGRALAREAISVDTFLKGEVNKVIEEIESLDE